MDTELIDVLLLFFKYLWQAEKAVLSLAGEAWPKGVSTRNIETVLSTLGIMGFSAASVTKINKGIGRASPRIPGPAIGQDGLHVR